MKTLWIIVVVVVALWLMALYVDHLVNGPPKANSAAQWVEPDLDTMYARQAAPATAPRDSLGLGDSLDADSMIYRLSAHWDTATTYCADLDTTTFYYWVRCIVEQPQAVLAVRMICGKDTTELKATSYPAIFEVQARSGSYSDDPWRDWPTANGMVLWGPR